MKGIDPKKWVELGDTLMRVREWIATPSEGPFLIISAYHETQIKVDEESLDEILTLLEKKYAGKLKAMSDLSIG